MLCFYALHKDVGNTIVIASSMVKQAIKEAKSYSVILAGAHLSLNIAVIFISVL